MNPLAPTDASIDTSRRAATATAGEAAAHTTPETPPAETPPPGQAAATADDALTPAMRQYFDQKRQVGDALLLFRMGDFYEMFGDDAVEGSRLLGIALTSRDSGRTALAGVPHHALETYLARLVAAGRRVAISEQIEDARQARGVIQRAVVRIVTPGTLTDEALLDRLTPNVLAALVVEADQAGLACLELASGELIVHLCPLDRAADELARVAPAEVLLAEVPVGRNPLEAAVRERVTETITYRPASDFSPHRAAQLLQEQFETATLEGFGFREIDLSLQAAGALLAYVQATQKAAARHVRPPRRRISDALVMLDAVTLRSLEVERTLRTGARAGSLLAAVDRTRNPMGARLLRNWLCFPLRDLAEIARRQQLVAALRDDASARGALQALLEDTADLERIVGRLGVQRAHPRDLRALGDGLARLPRLRDLLERLAVPPAAALAARLAGQELLAQRLCASLRPDAPITVRAGGIFQGGVHPELDRLRAVGQDGQRWLAEFQARESARTGVSSLKVGYNKVFGYYIEISNAHRGRVPPEYVRKQTVKNAERFLTDELKHYETQALSAEGRAIDLEYELFCELRDEAAACIPALQAAAGALAELDVLAGWAELAAVQRYCRPEFVAEPVLEIAAGRHPVIELALGSAFVPNDTHLTAGGRSLALITGPNMAGKSTYIRQAALLTLLAHAGAWVPAASMRLGLVDRIFTRVGAADELARGQSTFMVEMLETANILHNATPASLVILDEVGRGTSTFDGLALAWAISEHLAGQVRGRALFATHYHELTEMAELLDSAFNLNVAVREFEDQVVFLHQIVPGAADRSYGLHVAKLAGVPRGVLERANAVLNELERNFDRESRRPVLAAVQRRRQRQLRLFEEPEEQVVRELRTLAVERMTAEELAARVRAWRGVLGATPSQ